MAHVENYALKYWRGIVLLLLFAASFYFTWGNLLFWLGFAVLTFTDPSSHAEMKKPVSTPMIIGGLCIPAFFLINAAIHTCEHPLGPIVIILVGLGMIAALIIWKNNRKSRSVRPALGW